MTDQTIHEIDPAKIRVFISRDRDQEAHKLAIAHTKEHGQIRPGKVRDIRHLPESERRRPGGGVYDYALIYGQGRLLRAKALGIKFRAKIGTESEAESAGGFLRENLNTLELSWKARAKLISPRLQAGESAESIAKALSMSVGHVQKLHRIWDKRAPGLEEEVGNMTMNDAEVFTALPKKHQSIVMQEFKEAKASDIAAVVKVARRLTEKNGELSATALRQSLTRTDEDLRRLRDELKLDRLHHSLSAQNLKLLLADAKFRKALIAEGGNPTKFEKTISEQ